MPRRPLRIALISEHASPLATLGSVDAGGQNLYVLNVAKCLAKRRHRVDVLTRPRVVNLDAGPARTARVQTLSFIVEKRS